MNPPEPLAIRGLDAAASVLALGRRTVWALVRCDAIPHRRVGRGLVFLRDELRAWLDAGAPTAPGSAARVRASMRKGAAR